MTTGTTRRTDLEHQEFVSALAGLYPRSGPLATRACLSVPPPDVMEPSTLNHQPHPPPDCPRHSFISASLDSRRKEMRVRVRPEAEASPFPSPSKCAPYSRDVGPSSQASSRVPSASP